MTHSAIDEFDLPDGPDGDELCSSHSEGFVLRVRECKCGKKHFIFMLSEGRSEFISATETTVEAGGDLIAKTGANRIEETAGDATRTVGKTSATSIGGDDQQEVGGDAVLQVGGKRTVEAPIIELLGQEVLIPLQAAGSLEECVSGGLVNLNKFVGWAGPVLTRLAAKVERLEQEAGLSGE